MTTAQLLDRIPAPTKWFNIRTDSNGEIHYSLKHEVLNRRLLERGDNRDFNELRPREKNQLEEEIWSILEHSFS
jgi:hypothetical protein